MFQKGNGGCCELCKRDRTNCSHCKISGLARAMREHRMHTIRKREAWKKTLGQR